MVDNIVVKPLGLVLIVTAHMVFNGHSKAEITAINGTLGSSVTLNFTFSGHHVIHHNSHVAVYLTGEKKIAECKNCSGSNALGVDPKNKVVLYHISNLKQKDSNTYWATLFENRSTIKSNEVQLDVQEENGSSTGTTVPPSPTDYTTIENSGSSSFLSPPIITVLVVSPVVLLAAGLPCLIWCLVRTKGKQPRLEQNSTPTLQETFETNSASPPSVIYSVLDFPKRPSAVLEMNPNDTEYAAVSYLTEKRIMQR